MMTIRLPHILCGSYCISSLTWAGCVAYLSRWHAKASVRDKLKYDSHVFFCTRSDLGCRRTLKLRTPDEAILDFSYLNLAEHFYLCPAIQ